MLLDIEARIGELLPSPEEAQRLGGGNVRVAGSPQEKTRKVLPDGIDRHHAHQARTIKDNPDIVAKEAQARENDDIFARLHCAASGGMMGCAYVWFTHSTNWSHLADLSSAFSFELA